MDISIKRIIAYIIDILIITIVFSFFINLKAINPYIDKYNSTYKQYTNLLEDANNGKIDTNTKSYTTKVIDLNYKLNQYKVVSSSITSLGFLIYFGIIQYVLKGQTIGKKLLKIKIISHNNSKKLNIGNYIIRSLILNNIIVNFIFIIGVYLFSKTTYYYISLATTYVQIIIMTSIVLMVLFRKDHRGLHDIIANTNVIDLDEKIKSNNAEEIKFIENKNKKSLKKDKHLNKK